MIDGVKLVPLKRIPDERGMVMHMLRRDDPHFVEFGEIYFSSAYPGHVKGWHVHKRMILNYCVVAGMMKIVLFDLREGSAGARTAEEIFIGEQNYSLLIVPPGIATSFMTIGVSPAILANCSTTPHERGEARSIDPFGGEIPYDWSHG